MNASLGGAPRALSPADFCGNLVPVQFEKKYKECPIWRRNRLAARILLKAQTRPLNARDRRLAQTLLAIGVQNYLLDQGVASLKGRLKDRYRRWGLLKG